MERENSIEILPPGPRALEKRRAEVLALKAEPAASVNLLSYWIVLRKRRWTVFAVLAVIFAVDVIATVKEKPLYEAKALIEIERENPNIPTAEDLFEIDNVSNTFLETQYKVLESESVLRRVVRELHLDQLGIQSAAALVVAASERRNLLYGRSTAPRPDTEAVHNALKTLADRLSVDPVKQSRLVEVSFESQDPVLAARIVNGIASNYVDQNLELRWDAAQKASEWLSQQLVGVKRKLEKSEDEMQAYARDNGLLFLESEKGTTENIVDARLRQLQEELTKAQADRYQKESLYRLIEAGDYGALPTVFENHELQELTLRLSDLETQRAQLATMFAPDYPKLKQVQSEIDEAQGTLDAERNRGARESATTTWRPSGAKRS